jgi:hypothetical protein
VWQINVSKGYLSILLFAVDICIARQTTHLRMPIYILINHLP